MREMNAVYLKSYGRNTLTCFTCRSATELRNRDWRSAGLRQREMALPRLGSRVSRHAIWNSCHNNTAILSGYLHCHNATAL